MIQVTGALYLAGAFGLAGSSVVAGKLLASRLDPFAIAGSSLFLALMILLPACLLKPGRNPIPRTIKEWRDVALQAFSGIFLFRWLLLQGLLYTSSGEAGILTGITPAATALLAIVLLKEPAGLKRWPGIFLTAAGIMFINGLLIPGSRISGEHLYGNLLVTGAALSESCFNISSRKTSLQADSARQSGLDPLGQTTGVTALAFIFCLVPILSGSPRLTLAELASLDGTGWLALAWYGWLVTALAFVFWYQGIKRCEAVTAAAFSGLMPFTALALSVLFLGEAPEWNQWLGGILVIAGMIASSLQSAQSAQPAPASIGNGSTIKMMPFSAGPPSGAASRPHIQ